jgi:hypothetical protein
MFHALTMLESMLSLPKADDLLRDFQVYSNIHLSEQQSLSPLLTFVHTFYLNVGQMEIHKIHPIHKPYIL